MGLWKPIDLACSLRQYSAWWYVIGVGLPIRAVYFRSFPDSFCRRNTVLTHCINSPGRGGIEEEERGRYRRGMRGRDKRWGRRGV